MLKVTAVDGEREPYRAPDLIWDGVMGNIAINGLDHPDAPGDIRAGQGLATQVLICLHTDRRVETSELDEGEENRGWVGDSFDLAEGEEPLGSRLWRLRRRGIYDGIEIDVEDYVREALQTLVDQGAVVSIDVTVTVDRAASRVDYEVALYGRKGELAYSQKFEILWRQIDAVAHPLAA
ncbi:phage GP46 family protein [Rhizobium sp. RU36D]|uniref:phage GP46 family protein n=1 Tax=Rhizobium sp. RU36D TaxID=1907415 RepID=UPI0009D90AAF|nr:phage GP46 family protein [Rhizobium sp. RU36D]SMD18430.1 Mu-like prophage protein gp46 [Rhizobium sp. RU36D]